MDYCSARYKIKRHVKFWKLVLSWGSFETSFPCILLRTTARKHSLLYLTQARMESLDSNNNNNNNTTTTTTNNNNNQNPVKALTQPSLQFGTGHLYAVEIYDNLLAHGKCRWTLRIWTLNAGVGTISITSQCNLQLGQESLDCITILARQRAMTLS